MNRRFINYLTGVVLAALCVPLASTAQHHPHQCGVSASDGALIKNRMLNNRLKKAELLRRMDQYKLGRNNDTTFYIPIQWHVVGTSTPTSQGSYGYEQGEEILATLCATNEDYAKFGVQFYLNNAPHYWQQSLLYYNDGASMGSYWMGIYKDTVDTPVNIFLGATTPDAGGYYTPSLDLIFLGSGVFRRDYHALSHELGHFFSLPHTFLGWENRDYHGFMVDDNNQKQATPSIINSLHDGQAYQVENLYRPNDGSGKENCQYAADGFCDTWPNYRFGPAMGFDCSDYNSTAIDAFGHMFNSEFLVKKAGAAFRVGKTAPHQVFLANTANRPIYRSTEIHITKKYINGPDTILLGKIDTLGFTDTTRAGIPAANKQNVVFNGVIQGKVKEGYINLGGAYFDIKPSVGDFPAAYFPKLKVFEGSGIGGIRLDSVNNALPNGVVALDSIMIVNGSLTDTIKAGSVVLINKQFVSPSGVVYSASKNDSLPNLIVSNILPGDTVLYRVSFAKTVIRNAVFGDGEVVIEVSHPVSKRTYPDKDNIMSYFPYNCVIDSFSQEQRTAIRLDIVNRNYDTKFNVPAENPITDKPTLVYPLENATVANRRAHFGWDPTPKATMYLVNVYRGSGPTASLVRSEITSSTDIWYTLPDTGLFSWMVSPVNARDFCVLDSAHVKSDTVSFNVYNWQVGVEEHNSEVLGSKVYPNPTNANAILEIAAKDLGQAHISMTNALGQRVLNRQSIALHPGTNTEIIDVSAMPSGLYVIEIETANKRITHKLMVQQK